ncbi:MAG: hypothetical protein KIPDCIKN_03543 [Haliscomenobacter sp.]|nr:hypothetical protein [Haliscomenobacter sp.]
MIRKITINNFKSLKSSGEIALKNVNILTGLNGMGKSSLIQALLLLRQSNELSKGLKLRDGLVNIGTKDDALFTYADKDEIHLGINDFFWVFDASSNTHFLKTIYGQENDWEELKKLAVFNDQFQYISADRVAQIEMHEVPGNLDQKFLGVRGEYTVHFLEAVHTGKIRAEIPPVLRHHLAKEFSDLLLQTNAWLSEISPNTKVVTKQITSEQIQLGFSFGQMQTNPFKPKNVGFGLSYVLSVIVALLTSQKGGLIILENPEAHLHPRGQAKLGELIALAARNGAQIILEIHSDHILNGIRVMNGRKPNCRSSDHQAPHLMVDNRPEFASLTAFKNSSNI